MRRVYNGDFMNKAATQVYGAAASRTIDAHAIAQLGVPGYELMRRAADAAFACLLQSFAGAGAITVCCGKGNNAGDAYLVALAAHRYGMRTQVLAAVNPAELAGDARQAHADAVAGGVQVTTTDAAIAGEVIVDGLLGTGLNGAPREPFAGCIAKINAADRKVLAIDIPSGVSADSGAVYEHAVRADVTVSFITRKIGLYTGMGVSYAGHRVFDDLGVPDEMYVAEGVPLLHWDRSVLPALDANTYKHKQGHVVIAGGDSSMPGAVAMAAEAALRVGAGMVTAVTRAEHAPALVARTPEVMALAFLPQADTADQVPAPADVLRRADLLVLGPGLGRSRWSKALYELAERANKPTVLDADGLYWLAAAGRWQGGPLTITPHIAEAARLLESSAQDVQQDRLHACHALQTRYGCQGVLKGAGSVVFAEDETAICAHGNPGMATAGMGDVLSGVLGGLLATRGGTGDASAGLQAGVALHSAAADVAVEKTGELSMVATDVTAELPGLLR